MYAENPILFFPVVTTPQTLDRRGLPGRGQLPDHRHRRLGPAVQDDLEARSSDLPIVTVKDQQEFAEEQREPIDQLVLMIFALLGLALLIAVLGIVNTLALSIIERTREVGLLRAIGVSRRQLRRMVTLESVVIAVLGAVLGVVLGIGFGVALMHALREEGLEVIDVPVGQLAMFLVVSVVIGVLAALLPGPARRPAGRAQGHQRPSDALPFACPETCFDEPRRSDLTLPSVDTVDVRPAERGLKHVQVREYVRDLLAAAEPGTAAPSERELVARSASPG